MIIQDLVNKSPVNVKSPKGHAYSGDSDIGDQFIPHPTLLTFVMIRIPPIPNPLT